MRVWVLIPVLIFLAISQLVGRQIFVRHAQRATKPEDSAQCGIRDARNPARSLDIHITRSDAGIDWLRLEKIHQILEISKSAGAEVPAVVDGKARRIKLIR